MFVAFVGQVSKPDNLELAKVLYRMVTVKANTIKLAFNSRHHKEKLAGIESCPTFVISRLSYRGTYHSSSIGTIRSLSLSKGEGITGASTGSAIGTYTSLRSLPVGSATGTCLCSASGNYNNPA